MHYAMHAHIIFIANSRRGNVEIRRINSVTIEKSFDKLMATGELVLPRKISAFKQTQVKDLIRRGDQLEVWLGYNGSLLLELRGYVTSVSSDVPVKIGIADQMWWICQLPAHKSYQNASIPDVVRELIPGYLEVDAIEATVGPLQFKRTTVGKALNLLKDEFGIRTYMKGDTVVCGKLNTANGITESFIVERNMKPKPDLTYRNADDVKVKLTATSTESDGEKISVEVGDPDGETRELSYYNIGSESELKKLALLDLEKYKFTGYTGSFKAWGIPYLEPGDRCNLTSRQHPERNGEFAVEATSVTFDDSPKYERKITLANAL